MSRKKIIDGVLVVTFCLCAISVSLVHACVVCTNIDQPFCTTGHLGCVAPGIDNCCREIDPIEYSSYQGDDCEYTSAGSCNRQDNCIPDPLNPNPCYSNFNGSKWSQSFKCLTTVGSGSPVHACTHTGLQDCSGLDEYEGLLYQSDILLLFGCADCYPK